MSKLENTNPLTYLIKQSSDFGISLEDANIQHAYNEIVSDFENLSIYKYMI